LHEDAAKTSLMLGHQNPALLWNTYRALVSKEEAKRYWKITPDYDGKGEISRPTVEQATEARMAALADALY
jgi:hypothetical protein